jgi:hypothetical protein
VAVAAAGAAPQPSEYAIQRAIVLRSADADVVKLLRQAQTDILKQLADTLARPAGIGRDIRVAQLNLIRRNLSAELGKVWRSLGDITAARRAEAAARAIDFNEQMNAFKLVSNGLPGGADIAAAIADAEADTARTGLDRAIARTTGASYTPLSQRVYNSSINIGSQVDRLVNSALIRGLSAAEFAKEVRAFINPATPGGVRYAAMRLARTEINNAAHAMSVEAVRETPWVDSMRWHLSGSHGRPDICDQLASGGPKSDGLYPKHYVPAKPHPQCLCFVTGETVDDDEFLDNLVSGKYKNYLSKYENIPPGTIVRSNFGGGFPAPPKPPAKPKVTKTATPAKPGAKSPTQSAPPTPGATGSATNLEAEHLQAASKIISDGGSIHDVIKTLKEDYGLSQAKAITTYQKAKKAVPGGGLPTKVVKATAAPVRPVTPAIGRATAPAARVSVGEPISDALRGKVKITGANGDSIIGELSRQARLVPRTADNLKGVEYADTANNVRWGADADALGYYVRQPGQEQIFLNRQIFTDAYKKDLFPREVQINWCSRAGASTSGDRAVFAHEFGHHVAEQIARLPFAERRDFFNGIADALGVRGPAGGTARDVGAWFGKNKQLVEGFVSKYAATSVDELLAEIWHEYSTNPAARSHIKKMGDLMRDLGERGASL